MIATMNSYFAKMNNLMDRGDALAAEKGAAAAPEIATMRSSMALLLSSYQLFIHREVFEPLIAGPDADAAARARTLKVECISLGEDFRTYTRALAAVDLAPTWPEAAARAHGMRNRIRAHIANVRGSAALYLRDRTASPEAREHLRSLVTGNVVKNAA